MTCLHQLFLTKVDAEDEDLDEVSRDLKIERRELCAYRHLARCGLRIIAMKKSWVLDCSGSVDDVTLKFRRETKPVRRRVRAYLSSRTWPARNTLQGLIECDMEESFKL